MKKYTDNPKQPFQGQITGPEGKVLYTVNWFCGECGLSHPSEEIAFECCKQKYCAVCKCPIEYGSMCSTCRDKDRMEKAKEEEWDGESMLFDEDHEDYYREPEEALDRDDPPEFLYVCTPSKWHGVDFEDCVQQSLEDHYEDATDHVKGLAEMVKLVKEWNKKQDITSWSPDYGRKVRVPLRDQT